MALVRGTLAHATVESLCSSYMSHERIDIEVQGPIALGTTQCPSDDGCDVAIPHIPAAGDVAVTGENLAKAPVVPLQFLQPRQRPHSVDAAEGVRAVPLGQDAQAQQGKAGGCYVGIGNIAGDVGLGLGIESARKAWGQDVMGRATKAAVGMLESEDPGAQAGAVFGGDEGRGRRRRQEIKGGEDEESEGQTDAVVARVVVGEDRAEAALPVLNVAGCVERWLERRRRRRFDGRRSRHGGEKTLN